MTRSDMIFVQIFIFLKISLLSRSRTISRLGCYQSRLGKPRFQNDRDPESIGFIKLYAEDTALVYGEKDFKTLKSKMVEDLNKLIPWLKSLNLFINFDKTKYIIFSKNFSSTRDRFDRIKIGFDTISRTNTYNYLGLLNDEKLNWSAHIHNLCSKISK